MEKDAGGDVEKILAVIICLSLFVPIVCADTVYLKNGEVIKGKVDGFNESSMFIKNDAGGWQTINKSDIDKIDQDGKTETTTPSFFAACELINVSELIVKGGATFSGTRSLTWRVTNSLTNGSADYDVSNTGTFSLEYVKYLSLNFGLGAGWSYMGNLKLSPDIKGTETSLFEFKPMYVMLKIRSNPTRQESFLFNPNGSNQNRYFYGVCHLGLNSYWQGDNAGFSSSVKGGIYYAGGVGFKFNHMMIEALYLVNTASSNTSFNDNGVISNYDYDITYKNIGLNIGIVF